MPQHYELDYGQPAAETFFDATQEVLGTLASLHITVLNATTLRAIAGAGADQSAMGVEGKLRWRTTNFDVAHPGGAAGRFDVYATTGENNIVAGSPPTDTTDYSWSLAIVAQSAAAPSAPHVRKVGWCDWSGTAITRFVQTVGRRDDAPVVPTSPLDGIAAVDAFVPSGATGAAIRVTRGATQTFAVAGSGAVTAASLAVTGTVTATGQVQGSPVLVEAPGANQDAVLTMNARDAGNVIVQASIRATLQGGLTIQQALAASGAPRGFTLGLSGSGAATAGAGATAGDATIYAPGGQGTSGTTTAGAGGGLILRGGAGGVAPAGGVNGNGGDVLLYGGTGGQGAGADPQFGTVRLGTVVGWGLQVTGVNGETRARVGFFGATPAVRPAGYGSGSAVGTKSALTTGSTLNDLIAVVSSLVADLRTLGLIGA